MGRSVRSRSEESRIVSGTGTSRSAQSLTSWSVSWALVRTVTALRLLGRVARANASARSAGVFTVETRTTTWMRLGSSIPSGLGRSSTATRS